MNLDEFDRAILRLVQSDNRLPNREISDRVNLSETAVRRRLDRLRAEGLIVREVTLLDRNLVGETLIVAVSFRDDAPEVYERFRARMLKDPSVSQVYSIAGHVDFIIHVHAATLPEYERWAEAKLLRNPDIARYETSVVFTTVKFDTAVPI